MNTQESDDWAVTDTGREMQVRIAGRLVARLPYRDSHADRQRACGLTIALKWALKQELSEEDAPSGS